MTTGKQVTYYNTQPNFPWNDPHNSSFDFGPVTDSNVSVLLNALAKVSVLAFFDLMMSFFSLGNLIRLDRLALSSLNGN